MKISPVFRFISFILVICTVCTLIPGNLTVNGFSSDNVTSIYSPDDVLSYEDIEDYSVTSRDVASERNLNSFVFNTESGEKAEFFYPYDVKYIDADGFVRDKNTLIEAAEDGFRSLGTGADILFPTYLSDGISLKSTDNKYSVIIVPFIATGVISEGKLDSDRETVIYSGEKTNYEYGVNFSEIKENIVLNEYTGINSWTFDLYTNGLKLTEEGNQYVLTDGNNTVMFFGSVIAFSGDDKNNIFGEMTVVTVTDSEHYMLTVSVSDDWLCSPETVYPVTVDPTVTVNYTSGTSAIQDEIIPFSSSYSALYDVLFVGKNTNGNKYRSAMCFPGLDLTGKSITSASIELRDVMCYDTPVLIEMYEYTGSAWNENTVLTWSNSSSYGDLLDCHYVKYGNGNVPDQINRYSFDITALAQKWASGIASPSQGVLIKSTEEYENGNNGCYVCFASKDYASNIHKPSLVITYAEPKGYNTTYTFDTNTLEDNITVYTYHNFGNALVTYAFDTNTKGFPLQLFYAYNSSDDSWKLSLEETVTYDSGRYLYKDNYGTEYYFTYKEPGIYRNDALERELNVTSSEIVMETDGITRTFSITSGRISGIEYDRDNYTYVYGTYGLTGVRKNGTGILTLTYSGGRLSSAFGYTFGYTDGILTSIRDKYSNETLISRTYSGGSISSLDLKSGITSNGICLYFNSAKKVTELINYRGSVTNNITDDIYYYGTGWTRVSSALADIDPDDPHNLRNVYIFDYNGRTVNEYVTVSGDPVKCLSADDFRTDGLDSGYLTGGCSVNFLSSSSFENNAWTNGSSLLSDDAVFGSKVMSVSSSATASTYVYIPEGKYCISVYVKGSNAKAKLNVKNMSGNIISGTKVFPLSDTWVRLYTTFEISSSQMLQLELINSGTGVLYADCAQLEKNSTPTTYNVLTNSGFDENVSGWTGGTSSAYLIYGYTCAVSPSSSVSQTVNVGGVPEDTPFTVAGWVMTFNRYEESEIKLTFNGSGGTTSVTVPFNGASYACGMFSCAQVMPPVGTGTVTSVTYSLVNKSDSSTVYCDNLLLSFGSISRGDDDDWSSHGLSYVSFGDGTCKVTGIGTCTDTDIVIPEKSPQGDTVVEIAYEAFKDNTAVTSVTIPENLREIKARAFMNCSSLETAYLQGNLERIYDAVFYNCTSLQSVDISDSVTQIDGVSFCNCSSLKTVILPKNLSVLGEYSFSGCTALTKVSVPVSLTTVNSYTFSGTNLEIYYTGTQAEWNSVQKGTGAFPSGYSVYCNSEIRDNIYIYTYSGNVKTGVTVVSSDDSSPIERYSYDSNGNITEYTDAEGNTSYFTYDSCDNLILSEDPGNRTTQYTYDSYGNVLSVTDACGETETFTYYADGLLHSRSKGGTTVTYNYSNGLVSYIVISGSGYTNTYYYSYNLYGNLVSVRMGSSLQLVSSYTYTGNGRWNTAGKTESNGYSETYSYDSSGNLIKASNSGMTVYSYTYDLGGVCLTQSDMHSDTVSVFLHTSDGGIYTYVFSYAGNVIRTVTDSGIIVFADGTEYNELPDSVSSDSETDTLGRESEYALKLTQNDIETDIYTITRTYADNSTDYDPYEVETEAFSGGGSFRYEYDDCGRLVSVKDKITGSVKLKYQYDSKGQLVREDNSSSNESYTWTYDANGNITAKSVYPFSTGNLGTASSTITYSYTGTGRDLLTSYNGTAIFYSGLNPTNWRNASSLGWRGRQLVSITQSGSTTYYEYNSDGLRIRKTSGSSVTEYIWDGTNLIREITPNYTVTYLYDNGEIAGFNVLGSNYYYGKDSFGVIKYIYKENGSLYCSYSYDAWGRLTGRVFADSSNTIAGFINPIIYKGYYYDSDTGFYYLQSRYYDPVVGRFLNADDSEYLGISGNVLGYNLFAYCENNPIENVDGEGSLIWPGEIHWYVQLVMATYISLCLNCFTYTNYPIKFYFLIYGFADLYAKKWKEIWEIKPNKEIYRKSGKKQLDGYIKRVKGSKAGRNLGKFNFYYVSKTTACYLIEVTSDSNDGMIYYEYHLSLKATAILVTSIAAITLIATGVGSGIGIEILSSIFVGGLAYA